SRPPASPSHPAATSGHRSRKRTRSRTRSGWRRSSISSPTRWQRTSGSLVRSRRHWRALGMRFELPLSEACELIADCPHKTAPEAEAAFAYAVGTKAIDHGRIYFDKARPVDQETYESWIARATPEE